MFALTSCSTRSDTRPSQKGEKRIKIINSYNLFCGENKRQLFKSRLRRNVEMGFNKRGKPNILLPRYSSSGRALLEMY